MKHRSKVEVWLFAAILYVVGVLAAGGNRWIGGPVLLVLLLIALPQEYVTAPEALRVRARGCRDDERDLVFRGFLTFLDPHLRRRGAALVAG